MATFQRFEDIEGWQRARQLTNGIYDITRHGAFARDYDLRSQIRRASASIMSNIAERFERDGTREFVQFLSQAKGSAGEVKAQLYVALDQGYVDSQQFAHLLQQATETGRLIAGLMNYLRRTNVRGLNYRQDTSDPPSPN